MRKLFNRLGDCGAWKYLLHGITKRIGKDIKCPGCGGCRQKQVDRKFFHTLHECQGCGILFRHPSETLAEMADFYQTGYKEPGLTTELPNEVELKRLVETEFIGSSKDYHYHVEIFRALGLGKGAKILDYGANWGYATYQFRREGFNAQGFELSRTRADFGKRLGVEISTQSPTDADSFDAVYSCHVLEHVPSPEQAIREQLRLVRPGGLVLAHTPNGSSAVRLENPKAFHHLWGKVHPVLLTDQFLVKRFKRYAKYVSSNDNPSTVRNWSRQETRVGNVNGSGLFFVLVKPTV